MNSQKNNGAASGKFKMPMMHVDIECIHCGMREDTYLPKNSSLKWVRCPYCDEISKLELAIIEYLDDEDS